NILLHPEGAGVADYGATGSGKLWLQFAGDTCIQGRENDTRRALWRGVGDGHPAYPLRDWRLQPPAHGIVVGLPGRAVGSRQPCHLEPGMSFQQLDEALTDNSGSAKNSNGDLLLRHRV